jgi:hypothetical protein
VFQIALAIEVLAEDLVGCCDKADTGSTDAKAAYSVVGIEQLVVENAPPAVGKTRPGYGEAQFRWRFGYARYSKPPVAGLELSPVFSPPEHLPSIRMLVNYFAGNGSLACESILNCFDLIKLVFECILLVSLRLKQRVSVFTLILQLGDSDVCLIELCLKTSSV